MAETLIGIFLEAVDSGRKPVIFLRKRAGRWEEIGGQRALADVASLGLGLRELGIRRGDRVALLSESRYEWAVSDLAILALGAVTVPLYPTLTAAQCRALLMNCEAQAAIVSSPAQLDKLRAAAEGLDRLRTVLFMDPAQAVPPRERSLESVMERGAALAAAMPQDFRASAASVRPEDLATIIYTSGTTGEPKGAMLTHRNIASNVQASLQVLRYEPTDLFLSWLPLCHIFERMAGLYATLARCVTIAYAENFEAVPANALELRPTVMTGVPRFYEKFYARVMEAARAHPPPMKRLFDWALACGVGVARARFARRRPAPWLALQHRLADRLILSRIRARVGGRLRFCVSGSAPLAPHVMEFMFAIGIPVVEGYGLTETSPVICVNPLGRERPGSVGPPIPGVEVMIGSDGEILTRGPHVMKGYYRNEAATAEALRDGWFHTGDVGFLDPDGYLHITDRLKDLLILAGGKKVAPQPIEARLKRSPWIAEAVLLGDRRPYVVGLLVPNFANLEAEARAKGWRHAELRELLERTEVRGHFEAEVQRLNAELAQFQQIKRFALLDRELSLERGELTPSLKVKRRVVAENLAAEIERLYAGHSVPGEREGVAGPRPLM